MKMWTAAVAMMTVVLSSARTTSAQPYATIAAGAGQNFVECSASWTCEKTDVAFKLLGGYRVAPWIGGEAVYFDFGATKRFARIVTDTYGASGFGAGVALHGNFGSLTLTARGGAARVAAERGLTYVGMQPFPDSVVKKLLPYGGAALGYRFSEYVALAVGVDIVRSRWEVTDGASVAWNAGAATAGLTIGR